jgi:hypothetical protein
MQILPIFTANHATMKFLKLTALSLLSLSFIVSMTSCEKDSEKDRVNKYTKSDIVVSGANIFPASPSPGLGKLTVNYDKRSKQLSYSLTWTGLTDSVIAIRINGPAPVGFNSLNAGFTGANPTAFATTPYNVIQAILPSGSRPLYPSTGSYSGTLAVDGFKVKEADLLNNLYYLTIHTKTILPGSPPNSLFFRWFGEIRAQIVFQ